MKTVIIAITNREGNEVGTKEFNIDPQPNSKSLGYMIGYINALEDNEFGTEVISNLKINK
jgi:hypothetical protein